MPSKYTFIVQLRQSSELPRDDVEVLADGVELSETGDLAFNGIVDGVLGYVAIFASGYWNRCDRT